jgi:uncharacterized protein GlcG (DUF336 family)
MHASVKEALQMFAEHRSVFLATGAAVALIVAGLSAGPPAAAARIVGGRPAGAPAAAPAPAALTAAEVALIQQQGVDQANKEPSIFRPKATTRMHIAVVDRSGQLLGGLRSMDDAWEGSRDIAIATARTAAFFSSNENALTSRTIGVLSQAHFPGAMDGAGPLWGIWDSNKPGITGDSTTRNGLITFPGGVPLYKNGVLVGGVGVSGDGVDQDEAVAIKAAAGFEAPVTIRVNTVLPSLPYTTATPHP